MRSCRRAPSSAPTRSSPRSPRPCRADRGARRRADEPRHRPGHAREPRHARPRRQRRRHPRHHRRRLGRRARSRRAALRPKGMELDFWKIAMRPGKPLLYGRLGDQRVLGAAGNPVSALICAHRVPGADAASLLGLREDARAASPRRSSARRSRPTARGSITCGRSRGAGRRRGPCAPCPPRTARCWPLARADCLIVRAPDAPGLAPGARVRSSRSI